MFTDNFRKLVFDRPVELPGCGGNVNFMSPPHTLMRGSSQTVVVGGFSGVEGSSVTTKGVSCLNISWKEAGISPCCPLKARKK